LALALHSPPPYKAARPLPQGRYHPLQLPLGVLPFCIAKDPEVRGPLHPAGSSLHHRGQQHRSTASRQGVRRRHCTDTPLRKMPRTPAAPSQCQEGRQWRPPSGVDSPRRHPRCVEAKDRKTREKRTCVLLVCVLAAQDNDVKSYRVATLRRRCPRAPHRRSGGALHRRHQERRAVALVQHQPMVGTARKSSSGGA
jgi:hypothetical protein